METSLPRVALEYQPARKSRKSIWPLFVRIGAAVGGVALAILLVLPAMCGAREPANRIKCASNMKQIGLAAIMYANDHGGAFPDDLETILAREDLTPAVLNCPTTADTPATGDTTQAMLEGFRKPGHVSYVYVGKGLTLKSPPDAVVLYEPLSNHTNDGMKVWSERLADRTGDGMNVLFTDGHVEWLGNEDGRTILSQAEAGVRPIRLPAGTER
jgi:prepilin-type processing-associated H-X9-DG protein